MRYHLTTVERIATFFKENHYIGIFYITDEFSSLTGNVSFYRVRILDILQNTWRVNRIIVCDSL